MPDNNQHHIRALTGFRFLAASLVFIFHNRKYWRGDLPPELLRLVNEFHIGVSLFFVLSGFLIAYTYFDEPLRSVKSYSKYVFLRIARIMPLYWLILSAFYLDPAYGKFHFSIETYTLTHAFSNMKNLDGISQAWSLNVEMTFYFLAPFLCCFMKKHFMYLIGILILLFGVTVGGGMLWHHWDGNPNQYFYPVDFVSNGLFAGRSFQFLAGMFLAVAFRNKTEWLTRFKCKTLAGFAAIVLVAYCIGLFQKTIYVSGDETVIGGILHEIVLPIAIAVAIAGLITEKTLIQRFFASKLVVLLGNASFTFYLIHISYVNLRLSNLILLPDRNFILLWLLSIAIYLLIEKPIHRSLRTLITKALP
jgi:peptidoglycan/LPS O-acetylase OafA/YrhL